MNIQLPVLPAIIAVLIALSSCTKGRQIKDEGNLVPKTVEYDAMLPFIFVNGTRLHAEAFGPADSSLLVVLHGGPGNDYRYLLNCKAFAGQGYRVVFFDQRGSGLSERHLKSTYTTQQLYDDLAGVIAHYRTSSAQKVFLLGHSWGGMLATGYINKYPAQINGAVLLEPGGFIWQDVLDYIKRSGNVSITSEMINDMLYAEQFITGKETEHAILDYKYALLLAADGNRDSPEGDEAKTPFWRAGAVANHALFDLGEQEKPDWTTNLHHYTTKVLFAYSEKNKAYGYDYAKKVSSAYPNVQLLKVNGAGHNMISFPTGWNNFYPVALSYLNSLK